MRRFFESAEFRRGDFVAFLTWSILFFSLLSCSSALASSKGSVAAKDRSEEAAGLEAASSSASESSGEPRKNPCEKTIGDAAFSGLVTQSYELDDTSTLPRLVSLVRSMLPHSGASAEEKGAWTNTFDDRKELEGRVKLAWKVREDREKIRHHSVTAICQYERDGVYFGNQSSDSSLAKWERALNQAVWQVGFNHACVEPTGRHSLPSSIKSGYWSGASESKLPEFDKYGPATYHLPKSSATHGAYFDVLAEIDLAVKVVFETDKTTTVSLDCSSGDYEVVEALMSDLKTSLQEERFAPPPEKGQEPLAILIRIRADSESRAADPTTEQ